jgi:hypothetical protein
MNYQCKYELAESEYDEQQPGDRHMMNRADANRESEPQNQVVSYKRSHQSGTKSEKDQTDNNRAIVAKQAAQAARRIAIVVVQNLGQTSYESCLGS